MVSGFVTSPDDQSRICLDDASPMRIASKSLMSIKVFLSLSSCPSLVLDLHVCQICLGERPHLLLDLLLGLGVRRQLDVVEVAERLVGRQGQLAVLVDPLLALLDLLGRALARSGAERP